MPNAECRMPNAEKYLDVRRHVSHRFFCRQTPCAPWHHVFAHRHKATEKVGLLIKYNEFAGKAAGFGLVKKEDASIHQYVTGKLLGGPYLVVGKEEMKILRDPVGTGSAILKNVFGPMK